MGSSPSGYPITDYYFWLLFIIIPGSIIAAWISRFIGMEVEIGTNSANRKLATLRAAIGLMEAESKHDLTSEKVVVELHLDAYEKFALDRLGVSTEPPSWKKSKLSTQPFVVNCNELLGQKDRLIEYQRDTDSKSLETIEMIVSAEEFKKMEKTLAELDKHVSILKDHNEKSKKASKDI